MFSKLYAMLHCVQGFKIIKALLNHQSDLITKQKIIFLTGVGGGGGKIFIMTAVMSF